MGYRNYLNRLPKKVYEQIKGLTEEELNKFTGGDYFRDKELEGFEELHELGKYCDFDTKDKVFRFFENEMSWECDMEFSLASKEFLLEIINDYRKNVCKWYSSFEEKSEEEIKKEAKHKMREWGGDGWNMLPYDLNDNSDCIVSSWSYEYAVFELVRIYKTFDWENDVLVYTGG